MRDYEAALKEKEKESVSFMIKSFHCAVSEYFFSFQNGKSKPEKPKDDKKSEKRKDSKRKLTSDSDEDSDSEKKKKKIKPKDDKKEKVAVADDGGRKTGFDRGLKAEKIIGIIDFYLPIVDYYLILILYFQVHQMRQGS